VAVGLAALAAGRGRTVRTFKKGPDFIDTMWLGQAAGTPCLNLDFHTMSDEEISAAFAAHSAGADLAVIEGNKGLLTASTWTARTATTPLPPFSERRWCWWWTPAA
jgi:cobyrinic acid a,c-diamide synthase